MGWTLRGNLRGPTGLKGDPGPSGGTAVVEKTADQGLTATTFANITDLVVPIAANSVISIDGIFTFHSPVTTTGFRFGVLPVTVVPVRFLFTFEYQTSATAWATFTQTGTVPNMVATTASYVANSGIFCKVTGQVESGALAGNLQFQGATEVLNSAITVRKGSSLRYW